MRRLRPMTVALAVSAALMLSACSPSPTSQWRDDVATAASQSQSGDYGGADATLARIEEEVHRARDAGSLPVEKAQGILSAVSALRAQLAQLIADAAPDPEPIPEPVTTVTVPAEGETGEEDDAGQEDKEKGRDGEGNDKPDDDKGNDDKGNGKDRE